jgi:hypothetical protein
MCQGFEEFSFESPEFRHTLLINHYFYILSNTHINAFSMTARSDTEHTMRSSSVIVWKEEFVRIRRHRRGLWSHEP